MSGTSTAFIYASAVSAVFGIVCLPVLMLQPKAFVSPYAKADLRKRAFAATASRTRSISMRPGG